MKAATKGRLLIIVVMVCLLIASSTTSATVFINEVFINPPGPSAEGDMKHEFIELLGTPGMKLDGYAIATMNGTEQKYYPLGSIPPVPDPAPEKAPEPAAASEPVAQPVGTNLDDEEEDDEEEVGAPA